MTLRDLEDVFLNDINVIIGPYNYGYGFDPNNNLDVLCKGKLRDEDLLDYYDVRISFIEVIDESTFMIAMDVCELENVVIKKDLDYYKPKVNKMLEDGYTVEQVLGCICSLGDGRIINAATEEALYEVADPEDKCDKAPGDCWDEIGFDNPLL